MFSLRLLIYARGIYRGKRFDSPPLDQLAERMGAISRLNDSRGRYFLTEAKISALNFGTAILLGSEFWSRLNEDQRLGIVAHEFVHVRSPELKRRVIRLLLPSLALAGAFFSWWVYSFRDYLLPGVLPGVLVFGGLFALIFFVIGLFASTQLNAGWNRRNEIRCDVEAASYVDGEALIGGPRNLGVNGEFEADEESDVQARRHDISKT